MRHIGSGMRPGSLLEVALFLAGLVALYSFYKIYYHRLERRWLGRRSRFAEEKFKEWSVLRGLLPSEQALLLALAGFLKEPEQQKHLLFTDPVLFDAARQDYLAEHPGRAERLMALRVRLGHPGKSSGRVLGSTTELPPGTLLFESGVVDPAPLFRVREILPDSLLVDLLADPGPAAAPGRFFLEIQRPEGHYRFATVVLDRGEEFARLAHALRLDRRQNRRYVRRDLALDARVERQPARIVNLSGGGARLLLTGSRLAQWQADELFKLEFRLAPPPDRPIVVMARVVETIPETRLLRCEFKRIRESDRDRIVKFVLTPADEAGRPSSPAATPKDLPV